MKGHFLHDSGLFDENAVVIVHIKGRRDFCSGVLVAPRIVLTARHCVHKPGDADAQPASRVRVGFGLKTVDDSTRWVAVKKVSIPLNVRFDKVRDLMGSDVASLELKTESTIRPVSLSIHPVQIENGARFNLYGFGEDKNGYIGIRHHVTIKNTGQQQSMFSFEGGGCRGDSGGPIVNEQGELIGIVSLGTSMHCTSESVRYAQLLYPFDRFIEQNVNGR